MTREEQGIASSSAEYHLGYYATWVLDPDGFDIEVVNKSYSDFRCANRRFKDSLCASPSLEKEA